MNEASQDTSLPIIVFNSIKSHLKNCGASRGMEYTDERLSACAKRLMDMAVNYPDVYKRQEQDGMMKHGADST